VITCPLHDIVITNIAWCIVYKREFGRGVVYCPIIVRLYCTIQVEVGGGNERMVGSCTTATQPQVTTNEYLVKAK